NPPPAGRNVRSTQANTLSPETHWHLPGPKLSLEEGASPSDFEPLESCAQCALWPGPSTTADANELRNRAYFHKQGDHLASVPASWTDVVPEDPGVKLAAG